MCCATSARRHAAENDLGPEITLENTWQINYGRGLKRAGRKYLLDLEDIATREVEMMKHDGGDAIVELTCGGLSPDPTGLSASPRAPACIWSWAAATTSTTTRTRATTAARSTTSPHEMIGQILHGAWGTDVRAGMIGEIGCQAPWTDTEKRVMQAALIAAAETGAAINVHPGRDPDQPQQVADFIAGAGHPTERIVISHIDRTIFDEPRLLKLADSGVTIEFDLFGQESSYYGLVDIDMPNDATRLKPDPRADRPRPSRPRRDQPRHLLPHAAGELRRPRLRPHLPQRRADDEEARLQRRARSTPSWSATRAGC